MTSKLRIKIGEVEIDYEGTEEFLKQELPQLLKTAMELHKASGTVASGASGSKAASSSAGKIGGAFPRLSTASIAAKLSVGSGPDLILAAAAQMTFVAKKETFSRQELLKEMQNASGYYKKTYSNNLTKYLNGAIADQKITETATNVYALSAKTRAELEAKLADA
jgi:hypothetical protein